MAEMKLIAGLQILDLDADIIGADGALLAAKGDRIVLLPNTLAQAVQFFDGQNLNEKWKNLPARFQGAGSVEVSSDPDGHIIIRGKDATAIPMTGASDSQAGAIGLVPAPAAGAQDKYLRGDGTWQKPPDTTYDPAMQSANGLMTAADKKKLDGIATGAQVNPAAATAAPKAHGTAAVGTSAKYAREDHVHPSNNTDTHWTSHLYVGAASGNANAATLNGATYLMVLDNSTVRDRRLIKGTGSVTVTSDANGNITINGVNTTYGAASQSANGLMSAADKKKLDGIATGAQVNAVTGVKGNGETNYRTGQVNITPANIGLGNVNNTADSAKNVASAAKLTTARQIALGGDLTGAANFDGSGNTIINGYLKYCNHTVGNTNNYPFHRFAYTGIITGNYQDIGDVFMITKGYTGGGFGIF